MRSLNVSRHVRAGQQQIPLVTLDPAELQCEAEIPIKAMLCAGDSRFAKQVHEVLRADLIALTELHRMSDVAEMIEAASQAEGRTEENVTIALSMLFDEEMKRIDANPPRLHGTWSRIGGFAKEFNASADTKDRIEVQRLAAIERHHELRRAEKEYGAGVALEGWVDLAQNARSREEASGTQDAPI